MDLRLPNGLATPRLIVMVALVAIAACFPGARAPNVAPQRTLGLNAAEVEGTTSSGPFAVVFAGPKGDTVDPTEVSIVFNRPMRPLELASDREETAPPATIAAKGSSAPAGKWRWLGTSALMFAPEKALPRATEYVVTVPGTTKALDGSTLGQDYTFAFTTARPRVVFFSPGEGASHLEPKQTFELRFNQPVDPKEVERATKISAFGGKTPIAFTASRPKAEVPMLVKLTPKAPLPLDAPIVVAVADTLRGLEGPLTSGEAQEVKVQTYGPLVVSAIDCTKTEKKICYPHGGLNLELSNAVAMRDVKAHVRIEPPVPIRWGKGRDDDEKTSWVHIPVDLGPARTFRVVVTPGLKDEYGQVLAREHAVTLSTDDEQPNVSIGLQGDVFEAAKAKGRDVPVASLNVERFELVSGSTDELGLMKLLQRRQRSEETYNVLKALPGAKVEDVRPGAARNMAATKNVAVDGLVGPKGRGLMFVATSRPVRSRATQDIRHVSVTDLAISAKLSRFGSLVMVTRLSDGKPVSGATVAAREEGGREVLSMTTDARGVVLIPPDRLQPVRPDGNLDEGLVLFARSGDDWTYRRASDVVWRADVPYLDLAAKMPVFGMLFADRGIYKAGETVRVKGVFRQNLPKGMETPRGREMTVRAYDPEGGNMFEHKAKLGTFGELAVDIPIPATSRLGRVQIEALADGADARKDSYEPRAASTSVEVAAYRPAEFKVAVEPSQPAFIRGDKATFTVRGDYLFGAPMSGGKVRWSVMRSETFFSPPKTEGLEVGDEAYLSGLADSSLRGGKLQGGDGALNEKGTFESPVALALPKQQGPENVTFEGEVEDLSRQTIASHATALVHPAEFYVALKRPKDLFLPMGVPLRAEAAAIEPSGTRRTGVAVHVDLISRTWATATEVTGEDGVHYESRAVDKIVGSCEVKTTSDLAGCDLTPSEAGFYVIRARATDKRGNPVAASDGVYVSGDSARVAWPIHDGPRLELVPDKKSYEVGDVAKILVKNPYQEAEALVTIERQGIHEEKRMTLRGSMPTVSVPVTAEMWPNVYVSVELIKGRTSVPAAEAKKAKGADVGAPSYRIGWAVVDVNPEARRLKVDVKPAKKELRPGDEVDVDLVVTDRAGKGSKADVAFYAVDEGVLMLTGYKTPDPLPVFAARRSLSVAPVESRDNLARILRLGRGPGEDKGDEGGGGGEEGTTTRQDFRTTAFFQPSVVTNAEGKAHVRFKLPDSLTTFRLMAVATSETDRFGFGQESIVTSRPLMARPALPRFLRAGDAMQAGVILTSKNLPAQSVEVTLDAKGVVVQGEATRRVDLPANGSVEVRWSIGSPTAGKAELGFHAKSAGARDGVVVKRDVQVPIAPEAVALYGDTETAVAERLGNLSAMRTDTGGLDLRVSSTALVGLDSGVEALIDYPYGCAEQLTSKLVPLVALADLAREYNVKLPQDTNAIADNAIAQILKSQRPDGAFGYWPDSPRGDTWLTTYALWGLHLAKVRGRPVPEAATERATRWLREQVAACGLAEPEAAPKKKPHFRADRWECGGDEDITLSMQAFVVDVLAMTGQPDAGYASRLFARRQKMPLFARALLAHAMTLTKMRPEDAKELVKDAEAHVRVTPTGATISENLGNRYAPLLDSDNRTTAIVLRSLVTVDPGHPLAARLAKGLLAARRGGAWRSTQENAWALLALDDYRKAQEKEVPDFDARVFFGDQKVLDTEFHGRSVKAQSASFSADKIFGRSGQNLAFQVEGKGRLFYEARLRYARTELPTVPLDRGFFVKKLVRSVKPEALSDALRTIPEASSNDASTSDLVLVDLFVVTPDPRQQVIIDDPLPAGLEAVQANLATTARDLAVTEPGAEGDQADVEDARDVDQRAAGSTYQRSWYHREMHDDRVLTFVDRMAAGMYHYRYLARATTAGRFVVPPTRVECMYEPEIFGRTGAATFEVKPR